MRLYGKNPVLERLKKNPASISKLYLKQGSYLSDVVKAAKNAGIFFESVSKKDFDKLSGAMNTQGVLARIALYEYTSFDEIISAAKKNSEIPVILDGITDTHNLGSIIRSLACLGGYSVILAKHKTASVNDTVLRVASGGENYVKIAQIENAVKAVKRLKSEGFYIIGSDVGANKRVEDYNKNKPRLAVVFGAEGKGIRPGLLKEIDERLALPMKGAELSYNVSVAAALFCYEIARDKK